MRDLTRRLTWPHPCGVKSPARSRARPGVGAGLPAPALFTVAKKIKTGGVWPWSKQINELRAGDGTRYFMTHALTVGGFGKFHLGVDGLGQPLAVKEWRRASRSHPQARTHASDDDSIIREIQCMQRFGGVPMHDVWEVDGKVYAMMGLMNGDMGELQRTRISHRRQVALGRALMVRVAAHLRHMHRAGFVHHDVKLGNVLWSRQGALVVCDFGLARPLGWQPGPFLRGVGTRGFRPPELYMREPHGTRYDTWSLGIALADWYGAQLRPLGDDADGDAACLLQLIAFRANLLADKARLTLAKIVSARVDNPTQRAWRTYFRAFAQADLPLCRFVLQSMLAEAQDRASMAECEGYARQLPQDDALVAQTLAAQRCPFVGQLARLARFATTASLHAQEGLSRWRYKRKKPASR